MQFCGVVLPLASDLGTFPKHLRVSIHRVLAMEWGFGKIHKFCPSVFLSGIFHASRESERSLTDAVPMSTSFGVKLAQVQKLGLSFTVRRTFRSLFVRTVHSLYFPIFQSHGDVSMHAIEPRVNPLRDSPVNHTESSRPAGLGPAFLFPSSSGYCPADIPCLATQAHFQLPKCPAEGPFSNLSHVLSSVPALSPLVPSQSSDLISSGPLLEVVSSDYFIKQAPVTVSAGFLSSFPHSLPAGMYVSYCLSPSCRWRGCLPGKFPFSQVHCFD